eukprot:TRINITY_DN2868_c0_g1_i1.p2 TRINITY_DN2868_c0_g1~~TRINITY_DN2868_c0_g1_i1.p2  ORF type:complete len:329 (+),score=56.60 TRINITY_DN2868_c0_g1_i1:322-1308(+)
MSVAVSMAMIVAMMALFQLTYRDQRPNCQNSKHSAKQLRPFAPGGSMAFLDGLRNLREDHVQGKRQEAAGREGSHVALHGHSLSRFAQKMNNDDSKEASEGDEHIPEKQPRRSEASGAEHDEVPQFLRQLVHRYSHGSGETRWCSSHPGKSQADTIHEVMQHLSHQVGHTVGFHMMLVLTPMMPLEHFGYDHDAHAAKDCRDTDVGHGLVISPFKRMRQQVYEGISNEYGSSEEETCVLDNWLDARHLQEDQQNDASEADSAHGQSGHVRAEPVNLGPAIVTVRVAMPMTMSVIMTMPVSMSVFVLVRVVMSMLVMAASVYALGSMST